MYEKSSVYFRILEFMLVKLSFFVIVSLSTTYIYIYVYICILIAVAVIIVVVLSPFCQRNALAQRRVYII